jgi:hypothetical protein
MYTNCERVGLWTTTTPKDKGGRRAGPRVAGNEKEETLVDLPSKLQDEADKMQAKRVLYEA